MTSSPAKPRSFVRFSTWGLLVLLTTVSLVLAIYVGVGRAFGMTSGDLLQRGIGRFLYTLPMYAIWSIGLWLALTLPPIEKRKARLLVVAFGGMLGTMLLFDIATTVLIHTMMQRGGGIGTMYYVFTFGSVLLNVIWWIVLLMAIFRRIPATETEPAKALERRAP